jgi:protease YdgD
MRRQYAAMLAFLLAAACGRAPADASAPRNVFGADGRTVLSTALPYGAIGRLDSGCTATLVGRNLALTAAHCVVDPNTRTLLANQGSFHPSFANGSARDGAAVTFVWWGTLSPDTQRANDWAILKLAGNLGDTYGWLGVNDPGFYNNVPVALAGYSTDFQAGQTASIDGNCLLHGIDNGILLHDCDMTRGASGGPLLRTVNGTVSVVGVSNAERRNGGNVSLYLPFYDDQHANLGVPAATFLGTLRTALATP